MHNLREEMLACAEVLVKARLTTVQEMILRLSLEAARLQYQIAVTEACDAQVDLGPFTEEDMGHLFKDLMNNLPENTAIELVHAWIEENGLKEEFSEND